jgi:cytidine deaminase
MNKRITITEVTIEELFEEDALLINKAREATELSYSPYSNFAVGVAVLLENGEIVKGANQENASYPVGICAERSALATAQNLYPNMPVLALALAARKTGEQTYTNDVVTPCGMCRQFIAELEQRYQRQVRILMSSSTKVAIANSVEELLPMAFN